MTHGKPFEKGNTFGKGRPKGSPNKKKVKSEADAVLEDSFTVLMRKAIVDALKGDVGLLKTLLPYTWGRPKEAAIDIGALPSATVKEVSESQEKVVRKTGRGEITPSEGERVTNMLDKRRAAIQAEDFEKRLERLEQQGIARPEGDTFATKPSDPIASEGGAK